MKLPASFIDAGPRGGRYLVSVPTQESSRNFLFHFSFSCSRPPGLLSGFLSCKRFFKISGKEGLSHQKKDSVSSEA